MAIVDTVRGRLARFNPPHRGLRDNGSGGGDRNYRARLLDVAGAVLRGVGIAGVALIGISLLLARTLAPVARRWLRVLWRLTTNFAVFFSTRVVPVSARFSMRAASAGWRHLPAAIMVMRIPVLICCLALLGWAASIEMRTSHLQADLFTLSYFVSEVYSLDVDGSGTVTAFWQELFRSAKPGAMFIYTDNGSDRFNNYFRRQCEASKLKQVLCRDNIGITPSYTEQKSELAEYSNKFDHNPKIKSTMTLRALRKG